MLLKKHPEWAPFKTKGMPNYEELYDIFDGTFATSEFSRSSTQVPLSPESEHENVDLEIPKSSEEVPAYSSQPKTKKCCTYPDYSDILTSGSKGTKDPELYNQMLKNFIQGAEAYVS